MALQVKKYVFGCLLESRKGILYTLVTSDQVLFLGFRTSLRNGNRIGSLGCQSVHLSQLTFSGFTAPIIFKFSTHMDFCETRYVNKYIFHFWHKQKKVFQTVSGVISNVRAY